MLSEIIEPRASELLELIRAEIGRSGCDKQLGAGVVLTGGGAKLGGLSALAEPACGMPVRVGIPTGLEAMGETLPDPAFATVVGLAIHGYRLRLMRDARESTGLWGRIWNKLK
jgi:cell division protein FtsA